MAKDLLGSDSDSSDIADSGSEINGAQLQVNEQYARKFEFNKKREEKQRRKFHHTRNLDLTLTATVEEKFGTTTGKRKRDEDEDGSSSDESSSEDEDEGDLATAALDTEILATIAAIKSKDPRVYDSSAKFYNSIETEEADAPKTKKEKPLHLRDYHRENLLNGVNGDAEESPLTYDQEQQQLKNSVVAQMHAAVDESGESEAEDGFLVAKHKPKRGPTEAMPDVENADKDPETFLSNFMSSRVWAEQDGRQLQPFESDDEDVEKADEYEDAYNMRFEDPTKANEKLHTHARDMASKYSVRRDETNPRQRKRDAERLAKEAAKQQVREEKARLRKLKVEEAEEKVKKIKEAAGLSSKDLKPEDWQRFVNEDWDDDKWDEEMKRQFGEDYYAEQEAQSDSDAEISENRKLKKPKFDDDIDIKDIIPDFEEDEKPDFSLSDEELLDVEAPSKKQKKQNKEEKKREAKRDRRIIEQLVEDQMQLDLEHALPESSKSAGGFRYRESSPKSFGLTARDILLADDAQLNQFAGLKKLAAFRDPERKRKDAKHLGKKARLRQWRKDTFGDEDGPRVTEASMNQIQQPTGDGDEDDGGVNIVTDGKKKRRRKSKKQNSAVAA
jgi:protein KRI1